MEKDILYSIGHGTRTAAGFLALLKQYGISHLADVRSRPYSRFNPQYNRKALEASLKDNGIVYIFMGDTLGGRPDDPTVYDAHGRIDYSRLSETVYFRKGIEQLKAAQGKDIALAMMCSESKPQECHRSRLIAGVLQEEGTPVTHIDEKGVLVPHMQLVQKMAKGIRQPGLFDADM